MTEKEEDVKSEAKNKEEDVNDSKNRASKEQRRLKVEVDKSKEQESLKVEDSNVSELDAKETENENSEEKTDEDIVVELTEQLQLAEDKYKRLYAEFENYKKRSRQETQNLLKYAQQELGKSIFPSLDNMERAINHAKEDKNDVTNEFVKGIEMVHKELLTALEENDFSLIEAKGETFDPTKHEAMGMIETDEVQPNHVVNVFQPGYMLHDRLLRPAMVQVARKK